MPYVDDRLHVDGSGSSTPETLEICSSTLDFGPVHRPLRQYTSTPPSTPPKRPLPERRLPRKNATQVGKRECRLIDASSSAAVYSCTRLSHRGL